MSLTIHDMPNLTVVQEREEGAFPLSIGTSLALEALKGVHPTTETKGEPLKKYGELWVNIRTLFRNGFSSIPREKQEKISVGEMLYLLDDDIGNLLEFCEREAIKVVFYYSQYKGLEKLIHARMRTNNTEKQKHYYSLMENTLKLVEGELFPKESERTLNIYSLFVNPKNAPNVLMLTNIAFDLLKPYSFTSLALLESHTGKIKEREDLYTKYSVKVPFPIPFSLEMMQVFGDSELFRPMLKKIRESILKIAKEKKWTSLTTRDKMKFDLALLPPDEAVLLDLIFKHSGSLT